FFLSSRGRHTSFSRDWSSDVCSSDLSIPAAMTALAAGDTSVEIPSRDRRDEIGRMAQALAVFRDTEIEIEEKNLRDVAAARQRRSEERRVGKERRSRHSPNL